MQVSNKENKKFVNIEELHNYAQNPRSINKRDFERLKKHIVVHGQMQPLVVTQEGEVLGGNIRLRAYQEIGIKDIWIELVNPKDEEDKLKISLVLNDRAGYYDDNLIANMMPNYNIEWSDYAIDFEPPESLGEMLKRFGVDPIEDESPEVDKGEAVSKLGEVYQLGKHRLMCGDAIKKEDVEKLMNGQKADMVFTSPPYNANTKTGEGDIFNNKGSKKMYQGDFNDNLPSNEYIDFAKKCLDNCFSFTDGYIFWNVSYNANARFEYIKQIENRAEYLIEQIAWIKSSAIPTKGSMRRAWEPVYVFSTNKKTMMLDTVETNVWEISNTHSQTEDLKACFPIALPVKGIKIASKEDDIVLDLFGGSGSTLIACEQTNRTCYMMEIDPHYVDVIRKRWAKFVYPDKWETDWENLTLSMGSS